MTAPMRFLRFNFVGAAGIGVQLTTIWLVAGIAGVDYRLATMAGVAAAVAHNFVWHWRWTWRDRRLHGAAVARALALFALTNGLASLIGNVIVTTALVETAHWPPLAANCAAIVTCGLVNFWLGDSLVFRGSEEFSTGGVRGRSSKVRDL